jgi:hypothetical protein
MLNPTQYNILTGLAVLVLLLAATNAFLFNGNRALQNEIATRGQYIQQSLQLEPVYQGLIRGLAELAAKQNDAQLRQLLASQGISFTVNAPQQPQQGQ